MTRRELLASSLLAPALFAKSRIDKTRISAITDEIGLTANDAIEFAKRYGLQWVELRSVPEKKKEYAFLPEPELKEAEASFKANGLRVSFLNTSLMKFGWPGTEPVRRRPETPEAHDKRIAAEAKRWERHMDDLKQACTAANILGVDKMRVFTGSRVAEPQSVYPRLAEVIGDMAEISGKFKVHLLIENEASQNVGTSVELAEILKLLPSKWIGFNWDPQNALPLKEKPFPDGYEALPKKRMLNAQIKGKGVMDNPEKLDWKSILQAMQRDGYPYEIGLETHIFDGTLIEAANISMKEILHIVGEL
jgi:sugar phosphate isomerase/epimerase